MWLGAVLTVVALLGMILWALHEVRRVDRIAARHEEDDPS